MSTGVVVTALHVFVAHFLIAELKREAWVANGVAFIVATTVSLVMNTVWSFQRRLTVPVAIRYILVTMVGLMVTMAVSATAEALNYHHMLGIAAVILVAPPLVFLMHSRWTYRKAVRLSPPTSTSGGR